MTNRPLLLSLLFLFPAWFSPALSAEDVPPLDIYLLIGQSNMAGRAPVETVDEAVLERIFLFKAENKWEPAANPLNRYSSVAKKPSLQRLGPGYTFARVMAEENPDTAFGLVVNARGGTRIEEWAPGEELYREAVGRMELASRDGTLKGILWHQGEGNSRDEDYLDKLTILIEALRDDLGDPDLPFVAGQVEGDRPVNALIARLPEKVLHTASASSTVLKTYDGTHFDSASMREFGRRYAAAMLGLLERKAGNGAGEKTALFDGKTFAGWEGDTEETFRIEDGAIVGGSLDKPLPQNEFLCTTRSYRDFELELQFKLLGENPNSGVQIRTHRLPGHHEVTGYQADLGDPGWWGSIYDESRRNRVLAQSNMDELNKVLKRNDWNNYKIRCEGDRIQLWINGIQTVDYVEEDEGIEDHGIIGLQIHGGPPGEAWFRDIAVRELF